MAKKYSNGVEVGTGFKLSGANPIDDREQVETLNDLLDEVSIKSTDLRKWIEITAYDTGLKYKWNGLDRTSADNWVNTQGGTSTGLEAVDDGNGTAWRLIGEQIGNGMTYGLGAVDLSHSPNPQWGAATTGNYSLTFGENVVNMGTHSFLGGTNALVEPGSENCFAFGDSVDVGGKSSIGIGSNIYAFDGNFNVTIGNYNSAGSGGTAVGNGARSPVGQLASFGTANNFVYNGANLSRIELGIGSIDPLTGAVLTSRTGLRITDDGIVTAPEAVIDSNSPGKALITKEYISAGFEVDVDAPVSGSLEALLLSSGIRSTNTNAAGASASNFSFIDSSGDLLGAAVGLNNGIKQIGLYTKNSAFISSRDNFDAPTSQAFVGVNHAVGVDMWGKAFTISGATSAVSYVDSFTIRLQNANITDEFSIVTKGYCDANYVGGGTTPTLEEVTAQGNTTSKNIIITKDGVDSILLSPGVNKGAAIQGYGPGGTISDSWFLGRPVATTADVKLQVNGGGSLTLGGTSVALEGATTCDSSITATDFTLSSDISLKENIQDLIPMKLRPVKFDWKDGRRRTDIGFIAQEVEEFYPEVVSEDNDGLKVISYSKLTAVNAARINELEEENEDLKVRVERLELLIKELL